MTSATTLNAFTILFFLLAASVCLPGTDAINLRGMIVLKNKDNPGKAPDADLSNAIQEEIVEGTVCSFYEQDGETNLAIDTGLPGKQGEILPDDSICICELENGKSYELELPSDSRSCKDLMNEGTFQTSASKITLPKGTLIDHKKASVKIPKGQQLKVHNSKPNDLFHGRALNYALSVGSKSILVVKVVAKNNGLISAVTGSETHLSDSVFGTYGDPVNLKSQYSKCSKSKFNVVPAEYGDQGAANRILNGIVTVEVDTDVSQGPNALADAAIGKLQQMFNLGSQSPRGILTDFILFALPPDTKVGLSNPTKLMNTAFSDGGGWKSYFRGDFVTFPSFQMHEVGHLLGLGHASEGDNAYGDATGMMGPSYSLDDGPQMCFNGAHMHALGWYAINGIVEINEPTTGTNVDLVGFPKATGITLIRIVNPSFTPTSSAYKDIYVQFNWAKDYNKDTKEAPNTVTVMGGLRNTNSWSFLYAKMLSGNVYAQTDFFATGCSLEIKVNSLDATNGVTNVTVKAAGTGCP
ncbi:hypothetical protein ACA910_001545 [Epithemia clementina (nom. ined.)]